MTCNYDDSLSIPVKQVDPGLSTSIRSSNNSGSTRGRQRLIDFSRNKATDLEGRCISRSRSRSRSQSICRGGLTSVSPLEDYNDTLKPTDFPSLIIDQEDDTSTYFLKDSSRRSSRSRSRSNSSSRSSRKSDNNATIPTYFCPVDSLLGHDSFACDSDSEDEEDEDLRMVQSERLLGTPSNHSHSLGRMGHQSEILPGSTTRNIMDRDPSLRLLDLEDEEEEDEVNNSYPMPNLGYSSSLSSQRSSASSFHLFDRSRGRNSFSSSSPDEGERIVIPARRRRSIGGGSDKPSNCSSLPSLLDGSSASIIDSIQQKEQDPAMMRSFRSGPGNRRTLLGRSQSLGRQQVKGSFLSADNNEPQQQRQSNRVPTTASLGASRRFRQHRRRSSLGSDGAFADASANDDGSSTDTPPVPLARSSSGSVRQQRRSSLVGGGANSSSGEQLLLMASMSTLNRSKSGTGSFSQRRALPTRSKTISSYTTTRGKQSSTGEQDSLLGTSNHGFLTGSRIKRTFLDGSQNHLAN